MAEIAQFERILTGLLAACETLGLAAGLSLADGTRALAAAGTAELGRGLPMQPAMAFPAGSIIKPCIGVVALALDHAGALSLDDPLQRWVPEFDSPEPTLRQVMHHTAGIKCFTELLYWLPYPLQVHNAQRLWGDSDALAIANHFPPYFEPGSGFHYSNCGYALLGLALERAASQEAAREVAMAELLDAHVWKPAAVALPAGATRYIRYDPPRPNTQALPATQYPPLEMHGYMKAEHGGHDVTEYETYSLYGPAGAMLSTLDDLLTLSQWLFSGVGADHRVDPNGEGRGNARPLLLSAVPADGPGKSYGAGVQIFDRDWAGGTFYGHGGNVMGWSSGMWHFPARGLHLAFVANRALVKERPIFEALLGYADSIR